jgi:hypothetical protein
MLSARSIRAASPSPPPRVEASPAEIEEAMTRLRSMPQDENVAASNIFMELSKPKKDAGWATGRIQEALMLREIQTSEGAADLFRDIMTGALTLEKLDQDSLDRVIKFEKGTPTGGPVRQQAASPSPPPRVEASPAEIEEAMTRLRSMPEDKLVFAPNIFMELSKPKKDAGWAIGRIQKALTLRDIQTSEGAADLFRDIMTGALTLEELDQVECIICGFAKSGSIVYSRICERKVPSSADGGGSAAGAPQTCECCYPCLFEGLHLQFMQNEPPRCVACNTPLHQTAFEEIMAIQKAKFSSGLGNDGRLDSTICTCRALPPSLWIGRAAQLPESLKTHAKECSFAIIQRMINQAHDLNLQSIISGGGDVSGGSDVSSQNVFIRCPGTNCTRLFEAAFEADPATGRLKKVRHCVRCPSCATSFCPCCGANPYHYKTDCESVKALRADYTEWMIRGRQKFLTQRAAMDASFRKQLQEYEADKARVEAEKRQLESVARIAADDEAWKAQHCKMCPSCGRIVEQTGGCDSMICGQDYHGGNRQQGCGQPYKYSEAPAYRAQDVRPRQIQFDRKQPQQMVHKWLLEPGRDLPCDACNGPIIGPKWTCINCPSLTICTTCEAKGPQALQVKFDKHLTGHTFMAEMPPGN